MDREAESIALEKKHVKDVYEKIANHFTDTRYKAWPQVKDFLKNLEAGSVVADIGCGSGKYLNINKDIYMVGSDCCCKLTEISRARGHEVMVCDNLRLPYRDNCFDAVISIAVIHHFATVERRIQALKELARICRPGGLLMVYVWAMEQKNRKFDAQDVLVPWHLPQKHSKHKGSKNRRNGERSSQRSSSFTMGYKDQQPKNPSPVNLSTSGISSSDTSPVDSPQHTSKSPAGHSAGTQSKVLTKCLSDASLQPHSKITSTMQKSPVCVASSQSLSSLVQNAHEYSCRDCKDSDKHCGEEHLQDSDRISDPVEDEADGKSSSFDESYINISFDKSRQEVRQGLYKGICDNEDFLAEDDDEVQSLILEEEKLEKWDIGSSLQSLGRFEVNPLLTVMRSLAHLEKSLSLPETGCTPDELQQLKIKNQSEHNIPNGHYKDLRVLQLTPKQATISVNSINAKGESFSKRTRGHGRSLSFTHQTSRDSSMESLSSSDDSVTTFPLDAKMEEPRKCYLERRRHKTEGLNGTTRASHGTPHFRSNGSLSSLSRSKSESEQETTDFSKYLRYYHVFREGELVELIEQNVPSLHIVKDFFDHANWCVVAEKVECWTI